jgi:alkanesulfonate monooxygenase SsuD/methylene tetrahydromethanopterin reductase-like flavin-dependent oxidoreductase (luciferase family)
MTVANILALHGQSVAGSPAEGGRSVRVGVALSPTGDWAAILEAAKIADDLGLDAVSFWDHYHSLKPEWAYVCGWSAYGAIAASTTRIRLVPMVICNLNYTLGVLAKESSILSLASDGRFELAIGAGDLPEEYEAWHQPFPDAATRVARLEETVAALRQVWQGGFVTFHGEHIQLTNAACTPTPSQPPRIVAGIGNSRRMIRSAVRWADELNIYADNAILQFAREQIRESERDVSISVYQHYEWDQWPDDLADALAQWNETGISRVFVNIGFDWNLAGRVRELADAAGQVGASQPGPGA